LGLDCFTDYYSRAARQQNQSRALSHKRFRFVEGELLRLDLDRLLGGVDKVAHLAGEPGVRCSWGERFSVYTERNVQTTQRLLEAASRNGCIHLVYTSPSSVYGPGNGESVSEEALRRPASPYGLSKLAAEELIWLYGRERRVRRRYYVTSRCMGRVSGRRWPSRALSPSPRAERAHQGLRRG
jgi:UDP-glucuronate 4-epimerase